jgi:hypothetical protein
VSAADATRTRRRAGAKMKMRLLSAGFLFLVALDAQQQDYEIDSLVVAGFIEYM